MTLIRIIKFAFQNIARNVWLSVITVSMLVMTLLTVNILLTLNVLANTAVESVEERIDVTVYFKDGTNPDLVAGAQASLIGLSQVRDAVRIAPEEALARFRTRHEDDEAILSALDEVGENPFSYSLVVSARDASDFPTILSALENPSFAEFIEQKDFEDYEEVIGSISRVTQSVRWLGAVLAAVFLFISILIVINTVRVAIYIYREEISIMRLVGASSAFIRTPFWLEAVIYSLVATFITAGIAYPVLVSLERYADTFFYPANAGVLDFYLANGLLIFGLEFLILAVVNILSASLAMRRYLKV